MGGNDAVLELDGVGFCYERRVSLFRKKVVWALKDASFEVMAGETLGVIGRNGSGKSTLLQLLAGITEPDRGHIRTREGVRAALLALKLGFLGHLTGRENAYLNGMLLGATKKQVDAGIDEILAFSELGEAFDEPIYSYSSGMKSRLGFAAAIQMKPDILLLDEVLGVGDRGFKAKSTEYMRSTIASGQTVVLVTHNMNQIEQMCDRVVWLERGRVRAVGPPLEVTSSYADFVDRLSQATEEIAG